VPRVRCSLWATMSAGRTTGASCSAFDDSGDVAATRSASAAANRADVGEDTADFCEGIVGVWSAVACSMARPVDKPSVAPRSFAIGLLGARSIDESSRDDGMSVFKANALAGRADAGLGPALSFCLVTTSLTRPPLELAKEFAILVDLSCGDWRALELPRL